MADTGSSYLEAGQRGPSADTSRKALFLAPLAAGVYYLAFKFAFAYSVESVVSDASDVTSPLSLGPTWGTHWLYRSFAEVVSLSFATFVAGGIARKNGRIAGLIGGLSISVVYLLRNSFILYEVFYLRSENEALIEPWYQHAIEGLLIVGAPFVGIIAGGYGGEVACNKSVGFSGVSRWHFIWLWVAVFLYATSLISPFLHFWLDSLDESSNDILRLIVFGPPLVAFALPLLWGLSTLAHDGKFTHRMDNILGPVILVVGWFVAVAITLGWATLVTFVMHAIGGEK